MSFSVKSTNNSVSLFSLFLFSLTLYLSLCTDPFRFTFMSCIPSAPRATHAASASREATSFGSSAKTSCGVSRIFNSWLLRFHSGSTSFVVLSIRYSRLFPSRVSSVFHCVPCSFCSVRFHLIFIKTQRLTLSLNVNRLSFELVTSRGFLSRTTPRFVTIRWKQAWTVCQQSSTRRSRSHSLCLSLSLCPVPILPAPLTLCLRTCSLDLSVTTLRKRFSISLSFLWFIFSRCGICLPLTFSPFLSMSL